MTRRPTRAARIRRGQEPQFGEEGALPDPLPFGGAPADPKLVPPTVLSAVRCGRWGRHGLRCLTRTRPVEPRRRRGHPHPVNSTSEYPPAWRGYVCPAVGAEGRTELVVRTQTPKERNLSRSFQVGTRHGTAKTRRAATTTAREAPPVRAPVVASLGVVIVSSIVLTRTRAPAASQRRRVGRSPGKIDVGYYRAPETKHDGDQVLRRAVRDVSLQGRDGEDGEVHVR